MSSLFAKNVRLPDERTGTFMVFKTFDRISYGLIMEATDLIQRAGQGRKPVGTQAANLGVEARFSEESSAARARQSAA